MDPAQTIYDKLLSVPEIQETGTWGMYVGMRWFDQYDGSDQAIRIVQAGGRAPFPQWLVDFPTVQIQVRGNQSGYESARAKIDQIRDALLGHKPDYTDSKGNVLRSVQMLGDVIPLGIDESERPIFSVNFSCIILPAATPLSHRAPIT